MLLLTAIYHQVIQLSHVSTLTIAIQTIDSAELTCNSFVINANRFVTIRKSLILFERPSKKAGPFEGDSLTEEITFERDFSRPQRTAWNPCSAVASGMRSVRPPYTPVLQGTSTARHSPAPTQTARMELEPRPRFLLSRPES